MRTWVLIGLLVGLLGVAGCATLVDTPAEVRSTYRQVLDSDLRQLSADWNTFWLTDRQYRLTRWYTR